MPTWLSDRDRPWLRDLLQEAEHAVGSPIASLAARWHRSEPDPRAGRRAALAQHVVLALLRAQATPPRMAPVRQRLFQLAASGLPRDTALGQAAQEHGLTATALQAQLFADLPGERTVRWPAPLDASRVLLLTNHALVQGLLRHADRATLWLRGAARAVLRTAWLHGTGLAVEAIDGERARLGWHASSSARSHRSLTALVPLLPWTQRYELRAHCILGRTRGTLVLGTGDPILPGPEPRLYDSQLERHFARDFAAATADWHLLREPLPIALAHGLAFPDFELHRPRDGRRWLLEIAGLRDPAALPAKLTLLDHPRCLLCLPSAAVPLHLRDHARVVPFGRRVLARDVLNVLDRLEGAQGTLPSSAQDLV